MRNGPPQRILPDRLVNDVWGFYLSDPSGNLIGHPALIVHRRLMAAPSGLAMSLSRRYSPEKPPGETSVFELDFREVIPPGVGIASGALTVWTNTVTPAQSADWTIGPVGVRGRALYATLGGGIEGVDYQLRWVAVDSSGNTWPRTALCLCAQTS
jgi:hypothetical protein